MSLNSTWCVVNMNNCGCDMFVYAPYLQSKFHANSVDSSLMSGDYLPAWAEIKVKIRPSFVSLILYLIIGHLFGGFLSFLFFSALPTALHVFLSIILIYVWLCTTVGEGKAALVQLLLSAVTVLMSRALGVQCSCRYLCGRWRRSPLIPIHRIRAVHLLDRVTNASPLKINDKSAPTAYGSKMLFESQVPAGSASCFINVPADDNDVVFPLCCLPLQSLVTVYRLAQAILFREAVPCVF
nr:hypothetical transcript [Hymenolepis microstoma]